MTFFRDDVEIEKSRKPPPMERADFLKENKMKENRLKMASPGRHGNGDGSKNNKKNKQSLPIGRRPEERGGASPWRPHSDWFIPPLFVSFYFSVFVCLLAAHLVVSCASFGETDELQKNKKKKKK